MAGPTIRDILAAQPVDASQPQDFTQGDGTTVTAAPSEAPSMLDELFGGAGPVQGPASAAEAAGAPTLNDLFGEDTAPRPLVLDLIDLRQGPEAQSAVTRAGAVELGFTDPVTGRQLDREPSGVQRVELGGVPFGFKQPENLEPPPAPDLGESAVDTRAAPARFGDSFLDAMNVPEDVSFGEALTSFRNSAIQSAADVTTSILEVPALGQRATARDAFQALQRARTPEERDRVTKLHPVIEKFGGPEAFEAQFQRDGEEMNVDTASLEQLAQGVQNKAIQAFPGDPRLRGNTAFDVVPRGFASTFAFMAASVATGGGAGGAVVLGMAANGMASYKEALARGASPDEAWDAFVINAGGGASEAIPVNFGRIMKALDKVTGGRVKRGLAQAAREGIEEFAQESFQTALQRVSFQELGIQPIEFEEFAREVAGAGGVGGFIGAVMGGAIGALLPGRQRLADSVNKPPAVRAAEPLNPLLEPEVLFDDDVIQQGPAKGTAMTVVEPASTDNLPPAIFERARVVLPDGFLGPGPRPALEGQRAIGVDKPVVTPAPPGQGQLEGRLAPLPLPRPQEEAPGRPIATAAPAREDSVVRVGPDGEAVSVILQGGPRRPAGPTITVGPEGEATIEQPTEPADTAAVEPDEAQAQASAVATQEPPEEGFDRRVAALTDTQFDVLASVSSAAIEAQTAEDGSARIVVTPAERAALAELGIEPTKNGTFTGEQIDTLLQLRDAANRRPARIKTTVTAAGAARAGLRANVQGAKDRANAAAVDVETTVGHAAGKADAAFAETPAVTPTPPSDEAAKGVVEDRAKRRQMAETDSVPDGEDKGSMRERDLQGIALDRSDYVKDTSFPPTAPAGHIFNEQLQGKSLPELQETLGRRKNDEVELLLEAFQLKRGGKKTEKIARIHDFLEGYALVSAMSEAQLQMLTKAQLMNLAKSTPQAKLKSFMKKDEMVRRLAGLQDRFRRARDVFVKEANHRGRIVKALRNGVPVSDAVIDSHGEAFRAKLARQGLLPSKKAPGAGQADPLQARFEQVSKLNDIARDGEGEAAFRAGIGADQETGKEGRGDQNILNQAIELRNIQKGRGLSRVGELDLGKKLGMDVKPRTPGKKILARAKEFLAEHGNDPLRAARALAGTATPPGAKKGLGKTLSQIKEDQDQAVPETVVTPATDTAAADNGAPDANELFGVEEQTPGPAAGTPSPKDMTGSAQSKDGMSTNATLNEVEEQLRESVNQQADQDAHDKQRGSVRVTASVIPEADVEVHEFSDPETEATFKKTDRGLRAFTPGIAKRIIEIARGQWARITREFEFLPIEARFEFARLRLRNLTKARHTETVRAIENLRGIVSGLGKRSYRNFQRFIVLDDLMFEVSQGRPIPNGLTADEVKAEHTKLWDIIQKQPQVLNAIAKRRDFWDKLRGAYIEAMDEVGVNVRAKFTNQNYFRHLIIEHAIARESERRLGGSDPRRVDQPGRGSKFMRRRGTSALMDTNYLEVEATVVSNMHYDIAKAEFIKQIQDQYDIMPGLKKQARELNDAAVLDIFREIAEAMTADAQAQGKPRVFDPEAVMRQALNQKQSLGFIKLGKLAIQGELIDDGQFSNVIEELRQRGLEQQQIQEELAQSRGRPTSQVSGGPTESTRVPLATSQEIFAYLVWTVQNQTMGSNWSATVLKGIAEKKKWTKEALGKDFKTWQDMARENHPDHEIWQPREGYQMFEVWTIPEHMMNRAMDEALGDHLNIDVSKIQKMYAQGAPWKQMVMPKELVRTLEESQPQVLATPVMKAIRESIKFWKAYQLINPRRLVEYNIRNASGDIDAMIWNPRSIRKIPRAMKEMGVFFFTNRRAEGEVLEFFNMGGMESGLFAVEMSDINDMKVFDKIQQFNVTGVKALTNALSPRQWWEWYSSGKFGPRTITDYRESIARYANYLEYKEQIIRNGGVRPDNYGASMRELVDAEPTVQRKAFKLSNELIGAYDSIGVTGQHLRANVHPFWSWREVNTRRFIGLTKNAWIDYRDADQASIGAAMTKVLATAGTHTATRTTAAAVGLMWRYHVYGLLAQAVLTVYNLTFFPDEERELDDLTAGRAHMILGRNDDGTINVMTRLTAFEDAFALWGADAPFMWARDYLSGRKTMGELFNKIAKDPVYAFASAGEEWGHNMIQEFVNGLGPQFKMPAEAVLGEELFPDVRDRRAIKDWGKWFFRQWSLTNEYKALGGKLWDVPGPTYTETVPDFFMNQVDPGQGAYWDGQRDFQRWMKDEKDKDFKIVASSPKGYALYMWKQSVRWEDKELEQKWLQRYKAEGGDVKTAETALRNQAPLASGGAKDDREEYIKQLSDDDRRRLQQSTDWYEETYKVRSPVRIPKPKKPQPANKLEPLRELLGLGG